MRRLLLGGLLACFPLGLKAQSLDQRPTNNDRFAQAPVVSRVIVMPPPNDRATQAPQDGTVTQMPAPDPDDQTAPPAPDDTVTTAPPPLGNPAGQAPLDNSVTSTPLPPAPPAEDQTDSPVEVVPNPLDTANAPPVPGPSQPAQPQGQPVPGGWVRMGTATLQALDKANAVEKTLIVKVGDTGRFASLDIAVRGCFVRPPDKPADATAFLVIRDQHSDAPTFSGWMDRLAPYMSMMAHPIYDVRIAGCSP
ncbi:MAG: DUF2155 domain-containing protein [Acetobacteraceae bacterium]|jgi:hypothetical protein